MTDYCTGIAYGSGYFATDNGKTYLIVRNLDKWYVDIVANETGYKSYESTHNFMRDGRNQWCVKARNINAFPDLKNLKNANDFCRAYIELHGLVDLKTAIRRDGTRFKTPRLRIYGNEKVVSYINSVLPAKEKRIQSIINKVDGIYTGKTSALYYQSKAEIINILEWINGEPKNQTVWNEWYNTLN